MNRPLQTSHLPNRPARADVPSRLDFEMLAGAAGSRASSAAYGSPAPRGERAKLARFEQRELIAAGGTALVYRGYDRRTGRSVAIKRLKPWLLEEHPELGERLEREAEILRRMLHPNVVRLIGTVRDSASPGIVLEYVSGGSLRERLAAEQRLPVRRALEITLELSDALSRAHHLGVIHRDIKPENVLVCEDGTPKLTDFGLARFVHQGPSSSHGVVGTVAYLCPEALWGHPLDAGADVWGLGALLFEMIAGRRAFEAEVPGAVIAAILHHPVPDLGQLRPGTPRAVIDLVERMLHKERKERPRGARQLGAEIDALLGQQSAEASPGRRAPRGDTQCAAAEASAQPLI